MRGQVKFLRENRGYIKVHNQKETYPFNEKAVIDVPFNELKAYEFVDFYGTNHDGRLQANYVRKAVMEWQKGVIIEAGDGDDAYWRIKSEGGRIFWFKNRCLCTGEKKEDFQVGDKVKFQCEGYYGSGGNGNQAFMVTKRHIGYITSYSKGEKKGIIDFDLPFSIMHISNPLEYYLDCEKYFYFVSYEISNDTKYAVNITVLAKEKDIIFDESKKWIDGTVTKVAPNQEYCIIAPMQNPQNTFRVGPENLEKYCDFGYIKEGQYVSFFLENEPVPQFVEWLGYITRFPTNPVLKDQSGRINPNLAKYEAEGTSPGLLYFYKDKIINIKNNDAFTHFWITTKFCGEYKEIPIKTAYTNLRYKVHFAFTDDKIYGIRAKHISIIGVEKAPVDATEHEKSEEIKEKVTHNKKEIVQDVKVINNFYSPIYVPNIVVNEVNNIDDFLELVKTNSLSNYIEDIWKKTISTFNISPDVTGNYHLGEKSEEVVNYFGDKIFPIDKITADDEKSKKLDDNFESIRKNISPAISNKLLKDLSPKCRLYVKVAVIVEYSLKNITLSDYSATLVMYGKALEQGLRDSLYEVIQGNDILNKLTDRRENPITAIEREKTTIGNYVAYIDNNIQPLSEETKNLQDNQEEIQKSVNEWSIWWEKLRDEIKDAGNIRNRSDHAGLNIPDTDLYKMKKLLFVNEGIFESLNIINILVETRNRDADKVQDQEDLIKIVQAEFIGERMQENYLIVGRLSSGEKAALHRNEISEAYTSYDEFVRVFEQSKNKIKVKILGHNSKGYQVSLKNQQIGR